MVKKEEEFSIIETEYQKKDREGKVNIKIADKKYIELNEIKIKKLSELVGNINVVIFTPDDINILKNGPSERRKFLDIMISQLRPNYIYNLNMYLKTLEQRNDYLKAHRINEEMLDIWDEKLADFGEVIYKYRNEFLNKIKEKIQNIHSQITNETISIIYESECSNKEEYLKKLKNKRKIDKIKGFTTVGIHRDDFKVLINNEPINVYGSQGQNRTAVLSLKLSELQVIYDDIGEYPILLLDDFMSELDEKRISNFLQSINQIQVIITCTKEINIPNSRLYYVEKGNIINK